MPSEKMRYWKNYPANDALQNSGLPQKARALTDSADSQTIHRFAAELVELDESNGYLLISHTLELTPHEVRLLLEAAIERAKGRDDIIPESSEQLLWRMIVPILERSKKWANERKWVEAVEPILVILVIVEEEMAHVEDEGFTLQLLVDDCFTALHAIAAHAYDASIAKALRGLCIRYNRLRPQDNLLYDDEWNDCSDALAKVGEDF